MSLRRFWMPASAHDGAGFRIEGDALHHMRHVIRLGKGDRCELLMGDGKAYLVEIRSMEKFHATAAVIEARTIPTPARPWLRLAVSMPRFATFDTILEKAVELGVVGIVPFVSAHSFVKKDFETIDAKGSRFQKIVRAATEQCGRGELMEIASATDLEGALRVLRATKGATGLFAFEGEGGRPLQESLRVLLSRKPAEIWIFVGSEGGFSLEESRKFHEQGVEAVTLGSRILRAETACLALAAITQYEIGQLS